MAEKDKTSSISVQKMVVLATIISALVGGFSGNLTSRRQNKTLISMKKDEIAHSLVKAYFEEMERLGITSEYTPIEHWAVRRRILEDFDPSTPATPEEIRDRIGLAMRACSKNRRIITDLYMHKADHQLIKEVIRSMREEIEADTAFIDTIPNTPEGNEAKRILRRHTKNTIDRCESLGAIINGQATKSHDLFLEAIEKALEENKEKLKGN